MPKLYSTAESVQDFARRLIPVYHPALATAQITYVFVDKASQKNGRPVLGTSRKVSGVMEFLTEKNFVIEVALDCWNELSENQRMALVDHLLERCFGEEDEKTGDMKWSLRTPDVQEFTGIFQRRKDWTEELRAFKQVAQQIAEEESGRTAQTETVHVRQ